MLKGRDQAAITKRLQAELQAAGLDAMIITSADAVFYSTGFMARGLYKAGRTGNCIAIVTVEGQVSVICSEFEKLNAQITVDPSVRVEAFPIYMYIEDYAYDGMVKEDQPDSLKGYRMVPELLPPKEGIKIGVLKNWITYEAMLYLMDVYGKDSVSDKTSVINKARAIKTPWEIEALKYCARKTEIAMNRVGKDVVPGMTHADVHSLFHKYCLELAPDLLTVSQAHTLGKVFSPPFLPPEIRIDNGDLLRLDGGLYANGYKADLGRTYAVGKATAEQERLYEVLWEGYQFAITHIGPGVRMCDIFNGTMEIVKKGINIPNFTRGHFGHSISCDTSSEEYPFISAKETRTFEPGMVMCIETPYYSSRLHTYNIEDELVVTENGVEMITQASPTFYI